MAGKFVAPMLDQNAFTCPRCETFAQQIWYSAALKRKGYTEVQLDDAKYSHCTHCGQKIMWVGGKLAYPTVSPAPQAHPDLPADLKADFEEAREIVARSPRGAVALLRYIVDCLTKQLGTGASINDRIADMVRKGLDARIQMALDAVRVTGNNAVHPLEMDLKDDVETATALFELVNIIVDAMIAQPKRVAAAYAKLPTGSLAAINKRDGKTGPTN